jgi:hypothetical protein
MTYFRQIYSDLPATINTPLAMQHRRVEIIILPLDDIAENGKAEAVDANGWPIGFFEETFGAIPELSERVANVNEFNRVSGLRVEN